MTTLSLDLLRIIASFMVVMIHTTAPFVVSFDQSLIYWESLVLNSLSRSAVDIFFLMSGYFLLAKPILSFKDFYKKRFLKILPIFLVWSLIYTILQTHINEEKSFFLTFITFQGWYHLWFCPVLLGLYLLTPFLQKLLLKNFTPPVLISGFIYLSFFVMLTPSLASFQPLWGYVFFFLLGGLIKQRGLFFSWLSLPYAIALFILFQLGTFILTTLWSQTSLDLRFFNYFFLTNSLGAITLFLGFSSWQFSQSQYEHLITKLSSLTLGIYLIHPLWLFILPPLHPVIFGVIIFLLSLMSAFLLKSFRWGKWFI